ncbi:MAG: FkbM family methyltransferase [Rhodoblastus sp.]
MTQHTRFEEIGACFAALDRSPLDVGRGVWIYGAGGFGRSLGRALAGAGLPLLGFIDRKSEGAMQVDGRPCIHPERLADADCEGAFYLHGLLNHYFSSRDIVDWAATRPFAGLLFASDLYRSPAFSVCNYWFDNPERTLGEAGLIRQAFEALDDEESRALMRDLLAYRLHNDPRRHPRVDKAGMYVPDFLPLRAAPLTFVDGGAYNGDTLEDLLRAGVKIADWIAFEPDSANLEALRATAARRADEIGAYSLFPFGLSDRNGLVGFASDGGEASHVVDNPGPGFKGATIAVARLDDVVKRSQPAYVKLDIEGAEPAALRGMERFLSEGNMFALSVYHRPDHLWTIPLWLRKKLPNARLRLRQHGHHAFDTVLYAWTGSD